MRQVVCDCSSDIGGSVTVGSAANTLGFQSCADGNCTAFVNPDITSGPSNYSAGDNLLIASLASPFAISSLFELTLGAGSSINYSASSILAPTVPELGTIVLFGTGLVGLAGSVRRRLGKRA